MKHIHRSLRVFALLLSVVMVLSMLPGQVFAAQAREGSTRGDVHLHGSTEVIALRNVSAVTAENTLPVLPAAVSGVLADGTLAGSYDVNWDAPDASAYIAGQTVIVTGSAMVSEEKRMDVTCTVRVAQVGTESVNVAPDCDSLEQSIWFWYQSDELSSIINGICEPGNDTSERWTNWNNRRNSDNATLTLTWTESQTVSSVNMYYYYGSCSAKPKAVEFTFSQDGWDYNRIGYTETLIREYERGALYTYTFEQPVSLTGLKVKLTQQGGTSGEHCVGLTELEVMSGYTVAPEANASADLASIAVDGAPVEGFAADVLAYRTQRGVVTAEAAGNAGVTILPEYENVVRILTVSEDGTAEKTYEITFPRKDCTHGTTEVRNAAEPTCTVDGYTGDTVCAECGFLIAAGEAIPATGHGETEVRDTAEPTCTAEGYTGDTYCLVCGELVAAGEAIPATGHGETEVRNAVEPTCTTEGYTGDTYCLICGELVAAGEVIPAGHGETEVRGAVEPTCTAEGYTGDTYCLICGELVAAGEAIPATGHGETEIRNAAEPTCTAEGYTGDTYCLVCGELVASGEAIPATGHGETEIRNAAEPTCTVDGYTGDTHCKDCGEKLAEGEVLPALGHIWDSGFCSRCGAPRTSPFEDVQSDDFFFEPVLWAVDNGITNGTTPTTFGPNDSCLRGHAVTFLWRAVGCPEPASQVNPFVDVQPGDFYYKAVLWAVENGITNGVDATHFGPMAECNRAQIVTFLYRVMGCPATVSRTEPFTDVEPGVFYYKAVLWAVENGITQGINAITFGPGMTCNRAQIVTFLYRAYAE